VLVVFAVSGKTPHGFTGDDNSVSTRRLENWWLYHPILVIIGLENIPRSVRSGVLSLDWERSDQFALPGIVQRLAPVSRLPCFYSTEGYTVNAEAESSGTAAVHSEMHVRACVLVVVGRPVKRS